ncbi:hypothetical protein Leryth_018497 [Lithospermum erythrorhizon]|nr:hypothetical protein Leryth_018497 [Lithospermum erythrorhizon]
MESVAGRTSMRQLSFLSPPSLGILTKLNPPRCAPIPKTRASISAKPSSDLKNKQHKESGQLRALRGLFTRPDIRIDAYIIPSQDAHQSEFIAECYMRRAYISGFTGSAGTAVVTKDKAALWTDGRYFLQAEQQLSSSWILMRAGNLGVPTTSEWLNSILSPGCRIGIDPFLFSFDASEELKNSISRRNHELVYIYDFNLVDEIWEGRPDPPKKPVRLHDMKFAGQDVSSKLASVRSELNNVGASAVVISMLDEVSWLLNLRGSDVSHAPVTYAYSIVENEGSKLFIDKSKLNSEVMEYLANAGVELRPYESILAEVKSLAEKRAQLWLDTSSTNAAIVNTFKSACDKYVDRIKAEARGPSAIYNSSPVSFFKAVKNDAELKGMLDCHLRDAAALAIFWAWLEEEIGNGVILTEVEVADKLLEFRSKQEGFLDTSFDTISGRLCYCCSLSLRSFFPPIVIDMLLYYCHFRWSS